LRAPGHAGVLNNLGLAYEAQGHPDSAETCYRDVLATAPNHPDALANLANIQFGRDEHRAAAESYTRALAGRRDFPASFWTQRAQWRLVAEPAIAGAPKEPGFQAGFAEWIRERIKPGDHFYLVPSATRDDGVYQWFTFRLLPNLMSEKPEQADWLIFYGTNPRESGLTHLIKGIAEQYGPGYSLARTEHAS